MADRLDNICSPFEKRLMVAGQMSHRLLVLTPASLLYQREIFQRFLKSHGDMIHILHECWTVRSRRDR